MQWFRQQIRTGATPGQEDSLLADIKPEEEPEGKTPEAEEEPEQ